MSEDVVIAGGGPNGLMLAVELGLAGVRALVLEREPELVPRNRANGLIGQVVRLLDRRGLHQRLSGSPEPPSPAPTFVFGGFPLPLGELDDNPLYVLGVPQHEVEQVLEERAIELGAEIRRGHELTGLSQDGDAVTARISGPTGDYRLEARFLVGADGGRSTARKLLGIGFPGVSRENVVSRLAHVTVPRELLDERTGGLDLPGAGLVPPFVHHRTERGVFAFAPFPDRPWVVSTMEWDPDADDWSPMTLDELRASARRVLGTDVPLRPPTGDGHLRRLIGGNTRLAERYRDRRVLLVGDAAHVHSAIGGPGLNLGLQDAVNLGWKLAAELHGWAPPGLLDTYESERRPVAERVVMHTQAQSALLSPGPEITALRELFGELLQNPHNVQHIADTMSGADVRYDLGGAHPLVGGWAPDLDLDVDGRARRLADLTASARPLLLDTTATLAAAASGWTDRVDVVAVRADAPAMLLRPDGYVVWAADADPDPAALREALTRWFGVSRGS
ncbi:FAD-dependent oxidoreductase [Saccharopolyspora hirsuta]|uniref:FAD-dependent oxidoreductase n=1 Tax=Saccharopolyspora hirsuta TaxID=1837 RepID=A0A5M7BXW9_SACHI|nr:FAD-dependent monooxygenase [Saccharopolyspora hirsuta]KAA5832071.1 FAD-dependent oxidoreductase [Saccharopolyspora hirsuta]